MLSAMTTSATQMMFESTQVDLQAEDDVQLTELKPVAQSRIKDSADDRDDMCTDALRALRSFSRRQADDELQHFRNGYTTTGKRKAERWKHIEDSDEFGTLVSEDEDCIKRVINTRSRKKLIANLVVHDNHISQEFSQNEDQDDELYSTGINDGPEDFDEYLDDRNDDEIYVYRQRHSRSRSPEVNHNFDNTGSRLPALENATKDSEAVEKPSKKPKSDAVTTARPRGRPRKKKSMNRKKIDDEEFSPENPKVSSSGVESSNSQSEDKELQSKINDIIEASYLLEQENNNIVENGHGKIQDENKGEEVQNKKADNGDGGGGGGGEDEGQPKKYSCVMCKACFKGSGGLRNHYKVMHATGPLFKCDECGKEFPLKERLKLHVRTHTGFKPYKCTECDKSFARGGQLVQHRRTHSQIKPYSCDLCSGTFTCAANLVLHVKRHNGQKDHKCEICGRGFVRRDALKKHLECLHRDVKSFLCVICNKTFKGHLPQHMRTHAQDRPYGCATCGQRFAQKSQLTVHQRTHSGQRPFRCLVCWQAFAHSTALKLHTRRHTGERPFKCAECNAGFTQLPHWKKHMKCIHGRSEPYCCRKCNSFFRIKNDLEVHEKECLAEQEGNNIDPAGDSDPGSSADGSNGAITKYRIMSIEKMRLLLAVLLKRISRPERLDELGFGKRLIDEVLVDSLVSAGKEAVKPSDTILEFDALRKNLAMFLEWTVPKEHWDNFQKLNKTPEEVLETLTTT